MTFISPKKSRAGAKKDILQLEDRNSVQRNLDSIAMARKYLRNPLLNSIRYSLSSTLEKLPFLTEQSRRKFLQSAAKRDRKWIIRELGALPKAYRQPVQFGAFRGKGRDTIAGSAWHIRFLAAVNAPIDHLDSLPTISLSFVTHNSTQWLQGLFDSLQAQAYPLKKLNLYFVDNASSDDTVAIIENFSQTTGREFGAITIHQQENVGFGRGHDVTFRKSTDPLILVSNVDLRFHFDSIVRAVRAAQVDKDEVASWELRQCPYEHPKFYDPVTLETLWSSYACILVRRQAYLDVGGFEERIFMYGEDVELSFRFRGAGFQLRYLPHASVTHYVNFEDNSLRPNQLSGSVAANVLLRHRYGDTTCAEEGMAILDRAVQGSETPEQQAALETARNIVLREIAHFRDNRRPTINCEFPFNGFDYDVTRQGHDTRLDSSQPLDGPLVSIVTRTHGPNVALLSEAISSVCNQTYDRIEHLIVEDRTNCAEDMVQSLRESYGSDIRYLRSSGGGRSFTGNTGLENANGALIMFLDNDDLLMADHVELLVRALIDAPKAVAAYSRGWEVPTHYDQNGRYREDPPIHIPSHDGPFDRTRLEKGNFLPIQNVLFRRTLFEQHGGFDPEIDHLEDWNLWVRYAKSGDFKYVHKTTALYRVPGDTQWREVRHQAMLNAENAVRAKNQEVTPYDFS